MADALLTEMLEMAKFESHLIAIDQWNAKVTIIIGGTHEQHVEAFRRRRVSKAESAELADYCRDEMKDNAAVVLLPTSRPAAQFIYFPRRPDPKKPVVVGVIAHEILHVTICILRRAEVRLTDASEEAFSYLHGYLMQEFWKKVL
jgi:hypothetical protein